MFGCKGNKPQNLTSDDWKLFAVLAVLIVALVGWARCNHDSEPDWPSYEDKWNGYSIQFPPDWEVQGPNEHSTLAISADSRPDSENAPASCFLMISPAPGSSPFDDSYMELFLSELQPDGNVELIEPFSYEWTEIASRKAAHYSAEFVMKDVSPIPGLTQGFLFFDDGRRYQLEFLSVAESADELNPVFERIANSLEFR